MSVILYKGDCLEELKKVPDKSVDLILCDLPYGTTSCKWDVVIPFDQLWEHYNRVIRKDRAIVLFGTQPFTSALIMSQPKLYRYSWIWQKSRPSGFVHCKHAPLKDYEDICVFASGVGVYNPQMTQAAKRVMEKPRLVKGHPAVCNTPRMQHHDNKGLAYPRSIIQFANPNHDNIHPTQKPVDLCEYLIKTYTNEGETVLDNTFGSGATGVAAVQTQRNYIGIEKDLEYFRLASERIQVAQEKMDSYIL